MEKVVSLNLSDNFIERLADFILDNFKDTTDFSNIACVFGGKRPSLFLRRALSEKIKKPFYPPTIFTIDEFVEYSLGASAKRPIGDLEAAYCVYNIVAKYSPSLLKKRKGFAEFLPWAREINSFIEQLDLENISNQKLKGIASSAEIGYDVPASINKLLENIAQIRYSYHKILDENKFYSRGGMYLEASLQIKKKQLEEFKAVVFCNFFYLHSTEMEIMKEVKASGKGFFIFQGSSREWSVLNKTATELEVTIEPNSKEVSRPNLNFYQGFDMHSEVVLAHHAFKKVKNKENTVIVLPKTETLIPLLTEVAPSIGACNVSMGYPLKRSSLFVLLHLLRKVQESKKDSKVYTRDYLNLIRHPLVKNLKISSDPVITRIIVHKLEELLQGSETSTIGGSLFLSLSDIEHEAKIYSLAVQTLKSININVEEAECRRVLLKLHQLFFSIWKENGTFFDFADNFKKVLGFLVENSALDKFSLNLKVIEKLQNLIDEFKSLSFKDQIFSSSQIWEIFEQKLEYEKISFIGSPLKGTQVLGLFETRSLSFENVIVLDLNEGVLPKLKIYEPLIPREVMLNLGLSRLEKEEEIQRYQFSSLIASAKVADLIYEKSQEKEKSRFVEEIFWRIQKEKGNLSAATVSGVSFSIATSLKQTVIKKTVPVIEFLKKEKYSASRLNTYLSCPLKFYYQYVLGLKEQEDVLDEPQSSHIGTFIHELLEETFKKFKGRQPLINQSFRDYFFKKMDVKFENELAPRMKSDSFLLARIIKNRLERFLDNEKERSVKKIICLEERRVGRLSLDNYSLEFNYTVDRIDQLGDDSLVIIDYKTGGADFSPKKLKVLQKMEMSRDSIKECIRSFQLPLYYYFTLQEFPNKSINAQIYNLRSLERKSFIAESDYSQRERVLEICLRALATVFDELFDSKIDFLPEKEERKCSFCPFRWFCV
ncbi:MAG: PD-(D/E)XK nuclease family protein [Candidatus Omnitrophica bacterium]|nr:PD-(D/E)XK nuclease family protein [Candidatus Omnitrophota bacterium]